MNPLLPQVVISMFPVPPWVGDEISKDCHSKSVGNAKEGIPRIYQFV